MTGAVCAVGWVAVVAASLGLPEALRRAVGLVPWRELAERPPVPWGVLAAASVGVTVKAAQWGLVAAHVAAHIGGGW